MPAALSPSTRRRPRRCRVRRGGFWSEGRSNVACAPRWKTGGRYWYCKKRFSMRTWAGKLWSIRTDESTGWPFRLFQTSRCHQNHSSVFIWEAYNKMQHLFWCQQVVWDNLNGHGHPVQLLKPNTCIPRHTEFLPEIHSTSYLHGTVLYRLPSSVIGRLIILCETFEDLLHRVDYFVTGSRTTPQNRLSLTEFNRERVAY